MKFVLSNKNFISSYFVVELCGTHFLALVNSFLALIWFLGPGISRGWRGLLTL